jgi:hypothetical protein
MLSINWPRPSTSSLGTGSSKLPDDVIRNGATFEDPDGYRIVLQNSAWDR